MAATPTEAAACAAVAPVAVADTVADSPGTSTNSSRAQEITGGPEYQVFLKVVSAFGRRDVPHFYIAEEGNNAVYIAGSLSVDGKGEIVIFRMFAKLLGNTPALEGILAHLVSSDPTAITFVNYFDPIRYATRQHAPVLTLMGTHDEFFPLPNANLMLQAITSAGTQDKFEKRLWLVPNAPHTFADGVLDLLALLPGLSGWPD